MYLCMSLCVYLFNFIVQATRGADLRTQTQAQSLATWLPIIHVL